MTVAERKLQKIEWKARMLEKVSLVHKRKKLEVVDRISKRMDGLKHSLVARSKKCGVECSATVDELRELVYNTYGTKCIYCPKIITLKTMVVDHIIPMSKGGNSNIENLQVICKTSNSVKGSLTAENFQILRDWLETVPEELKRDISIRLARGIN